MIKFSSFQKSGFVLKNDKTSLNVDYRTRTPDFTQKEVDFSPPLFCRSPRRKENRRFPFQHLLKEISTQFGPTDARVSRTPPPLQELTVQERFTWSDAKNASKIVDKCKSSLDFAQNRDGKRKNRTVRPPTSPVRF